MRLTELLTVINPDSLVCIEDYKTDKCIFCCPLGDITMGDIKPYRNYTVMSVYPEAYGKYYGFHGITIRVME